MDIKVDLPVEAKVEAKEPDTVVSSTGQLLVQSVAEMFDLKPSESAKYQGKLQLLTDYAKSVTDNHSPENLKWAIRNLGIKVGTPPLGEKLVVYLAKYAYLHLEGLEIEKAKQQYIKSSE